MSTPESSSAAVPAETSAAGSVVEAVQPLPTGLAEPRPPRLWPGVAIAALQWAGMLIPAWIAPGEMLHIMLAMWSPLLATGLFALWWLFFSRVPWKERFLVLGLCVVIGIGATFAYDPSWRGMGGMFIFLHVFPVLTSIWIVWLLATMVVRWPFRRNGLVWLFLLVWGFFGLTRVDGVTGTFSLETSYRWEPSPEELFAKEVKSGRAADGKAATTDEVVLSLEAGDWPGFRGADRDGSLTGVRIATDWSAKPPKELWRHRVGPAWSSFAIVGNRAYTQEQRGEEEAVVCYDASTGQELWVHLDQARFNEAIAGPGPRATPTFHNGKIYAQGASGILNCLDARTGKPLWTADIVKDSGAKPPTWGYAGSPTVAAGIVSVFAGGTAEKSDLKSSAGERRGRDDADSGEPGGKSVLGYSADTGKLVWSAGKGEFSYCSTQLSRIAGVDQLLICTEAGVTAYDPAKGTVLWQHDWPLEGGMARVVQPAIVGGTDVLIGTGFGNGTQRVHVSREGDKWTTKEIWWSKAFKPYFNDMVVHGNHLYGFDGNMFVCVGLDDGKVKWKARGYGNGEVLLLADQGLLIVQAEQGDLALLEASPDKHVALCQIKAMTGKTWNHPVVAHGKLYVRNAEEAVCYQLEELEESAQ
jgi:outer membrane protein assembly factor BamB